MFSEDKNLTPPVKLGTIMLDEECVGISRSGTGVFKVDGFIIFADRLCNVGKQYCYVVNRVCERYAFCVIISREEALEQLKEKNSNEE